MRWRLYQDDYLTRMRQLVDNSIDALISDPPYGTTALSWDKKIKLEEFWQEARRICKPGAVIVLFSQQPFTTELINSNRKCFRYETIWHKTNAVGWLDAKRRPLRAHENILIFTDRFAESTYNPQMMQGCKPYRNASRGIAVHYGRHRASAVHSAFAGDSISEDGARYPRSVLLFSNRNHPSLHPTQKPLELMQWLVKSYSNEGDTILDPFAGSGSTGEACLRTGREFVGIEKDEKYYRVAEQRLSAVA